MHARPNLRCADTVSRAFDPAARRRVAPDRVVMPRVLLVDDEPLIALLLQEYLTELGCETIGPAHTVSVAFDLIKATPPDAAFLDVALRNEVSYPVADVLRVRGIPFMFLTGYIPEGLDIRFRDELIVSKPFDFEIIKEALSNSLESGALQHKCSGKSVEKEMRTTAPHLRSGRFKS